MKNTDIVIDALTDKINSVTDKSVSYQSQLSRHFDFILNQSEDAQLDFVKYIYLHTFDENMHGRDANVFKVACDTIKPILECAENKEFHLSVNDYLIRLDECLNQINYAGEIYDTDHLFGHELNYDFGYKDTSDD